MNSRLVTTGNVPLTVYSVETFRFSAFKNSLLWDLTGGTAVLKLYDPAGTVTSYTATIDGSSGRYTLALPDLPGTWVRAWDLTDAEGVRQISRPFVFSVVRSPA